MNIILLLIWVIILLLVLVTFYLNHKILDNYVEKNTLKQKTSPPKCNYGSKNLPKIDPSILSKCKIVNSIQTYIYKSEDINYEISEIPYFYTKVCSGFCTEGMSTLGNCLSANEKLKQENCLSAFTPNKGCVPSTAAPIAYETNSKNLFPRGPINTLNSC